MVKAIKFYCVLFIIGTNFSSCNSNPFKGDNIQSYFDYLFENDINGQIQMFTVEKNDEWKGLFYLLLPLSTRSTIDYKSTNPKVNTIHSYYQAKYNLIDWPSGAIIKYPFESLDFKNPIDFMLGIIHLDSENASQDLKKLHLN